MVERNRSGDRHCVGDRSSRRRCAAATRASRGLPATSAPCATVHGAPSRSVTMPPASRTSSMPAAMSHGARLSSQKASKRPQATSARSSAAAPARRMPDVARMTRGELAQIASRCPRCLNGKPGADQRARRIGDRRDTRSARRARRAPPPRVAVNSSPRGDVEHTPATTLAVDQRGDRHRVPREAVQEVRRAVERIDDERRARASDSASGEPPRR